MHMQTPVHSDTLEDTHILMPIQTRSTLQSFVTLIWLAMGKKSPSQCGYAGKSHSTEVALPTRGLLA